MTIRHYFRFSSKKIIAIPGKMADAAVRSNPFNERSGNSKLSGNFDLVLRGRWLCPQLMTGSAVGQLRHLITIAFNCAII
jgi:hypothetical protein